MDALKNNLPIPNNERIRPFCYFNAVVLSSPLEKCKLAIDELIEAFQFSHLAATSSEPGKIGGVLVASEDATAGKHHNIGCIVEFQITLEIIFVPFLR